MLGAHRAIFEIHGTEPNDGAENENRTAKSVNTCILICFKFLKVILIVSLPFISLFKTN